MGACDFNYEVKGKTARQAFDNAVSTAQYDFGHAGYTGTIAEKYEFTMIPLPDGKDANDYANELIRIGDKRIDDKWGPAGCIDLGDEKFLFFGWASE